MQRQDFDSTLDKIEQANLEAAISQVETALISAGQGARSVFERFIQNARSRVGVLEKRIKGAETEREAQSRENAATISRLAEAEAALSTEERKTFSEFLVKDRFTKGDLHKLEEFYRNSYQRLSEAGRKSLSHRVWEGVRQDEYRFSELPVIVQEKETERAYAVFKRRDIGSDVLSDIAVKDRGDFISAYEAGRRDEACRTLDRPSFKDYLFKGAAPERRIGFEAQSGRETDRVAVEIEAGKAVEVISPPHGGKGAVSLKGINLEGITLKESEAQISAAMVPRETAPSTGKDKLSR